MTTSRCASVLLGAATTLVACLLVGVPGHAYAEPVAMSAEARAVFEQAKDQLLQLRVIHKGTRTLPALRAESFRTNFRGSDAVQ
jgi:hypothetical protein